MSKHTPGPWSRSSGWQPSASMVDTENIYGGGGRAGVVAHVVRASQDGEYSKEREANARLIAAAPELLEAVRDLAAICAFPQFSGITNGSALAAARAAIAKAEGTK